jgi:hypothetical protein
MKRKSPNLKIASAKCRCCGRFWRPPVGVSATQAFCKKCSVERRSSAREGLDLRELRRTDFTGPYLLPRRFRST